MDWNLFVLFRAWEQKARICIPSSCLLSSWAQMFHSPLMFTCWKTVWNCGKSPRVYLSQRFILGINVSTQSLGPYAFCTLPVKSICTPDWRNRLKGLGFNGWTGFCRQIWIVVSYECFQNCWIFWDSIVKEMMRSTSASVHLIVFKKLPKLENKSLQSWEAFDIFDVVTSSKCLSVIS